MRERAAAPRGGVVADDSCILTRDAAPWYICGIGESLLVLEAAFTSDIASVPPDPPLGWPSIEGNRCESSLCLSVESCDSEPLVVALFPHCSADIDSKDTLDF